MAIDPMQVIAMQRALMGGLGGGVPGSYGAAPQAFGGLLQPQLYPGHPLYPGPRIPIDFLGRRILYRSLPPGGSLTGVQLAPQGAIANALAQRGLTVGGALGGMFPKPIALTTVPIRRQLLPFGVDPLTAAYAGGQLAPQGFAGGPLQPQTLFGPSPSMDQRSGLGRLLASLRLRGPIGSIIL
jgi:hypothetical protein